MRTLYIGMLALAACAPTIPDSGAGGVDAFGTGGQAQNGADEAGDQPSAPSPTSVQPTTPTVVATPAGATRYECDTGATVFATINNRRATVTFGNGDSIAMGRVQGASVSGQTYAADGWIWFVDGANAVLTEQGGQTNCRVSAL